MKREVIGCMGGGGNHLRWLLLLDPSFTYLRGYAPDNYSFITNCVYPNDRNWQNWLNYEWRYRLEVEDLIAFSHGRDIQSDTRYCALITDPDQAVKHYLKFNSNLNNTLLPTFKRHIQEYNSNVTTKSKAHSNVMLVDSKELYQSTLNKELYNKLIEWFELEDHYSQANEIHGRWWTLNQKAEQEIIKDLRKIYHD